MEKLQPIKFSNIMKKVIGNEFKEYGFKTKDTRLIRENEGMKDEIYFQRSQFNVQRSQNIFYLNMYVHPNEGNCFTNIRLNYPTKLKAPEYYLEYLSMPQGQREHIYAAFSAQQKQEVADWYLSTQWLYSSEDELIEILLKAKKLLITKGFYYFDEVRKMIKNISDDNERNNKVFELEAFLNVIE